MSPFVAPLFSRELRFDQTFICTTCALTQVSVFLTQIYSRDHDLNTHEYTLSEDPSTQV